VAFNSRASNLVAGDTNGVSDIFLKDRLTGSIQRVSISSAGTQGNNGNLWPSMDATGRIVAFGSYASNLVSGDTNTAADVFLRDVLANTTTRVSVASNGTQGNGESDRCALSANGRKLVFASSASNLVAGDTNGLHDIFVKDLVTGGMERVSVSSAGVQSNDWSEYPAISADGNVVAFGSRASNLVPGDTNGAYDVFVRRLAEGTTQRVSVNQVGTQGDQESSFPVLNADGRFVAFRSAATNLVGFDDNGVEDVYMKHLTGAGFGGNEPIRSARLEVGRGRSVRLAIDFRTPLTGTVELRIVSASLKLQVPPSVKSKAGTRTLTVDFALSAPLESGDVLFVELERLGRTTRAQVKVR